MENLKSWSLRASNHAFPKLAYSKHKFFALIWFILFLASSLYCAISIINDIYRYSRHKINTKVNITNAIAAEIPTISICVDFELRNDSNFRLNLSDCEITRGRYLEPEKCENESFYRHPNGECFTFNTSGRLDVTAETPHVGIKFMFRNNDSNSTGIFVIVHHKDRIPLRPSYDNHYIDLFACNKAKTRIKYAVAGRKHTWKMYDCVDDWSSIISNVSNEIPDYLKHEYNEEACFFKCLDVVKSNEKCSYMCPVKCDVSSYIVRESRYCETKTGDDEESTVSVHFRDASFTSITEIESMSFRQLMGAIGGRLSIALGMSIISLIDFIEGTGWIVFSVFTRKKQTTESEPERVQLEYFYRIKNWCLNSNIHGVAHIAKSKYTFFRVLWSLGIISCLIYCVITLSNNMAIYLNYEVRSTYSVERSMQTYYPAITFCYDTDLRNDSIFIQKHCLDSNEEKEFKAGDLIYKKIQRHHLCFTLNALKSNSNTTSLASVSANGNSDMCTFTFVLDKDSKIGLSIHNQSIMPFYGKELTIQEGEELSIGLSRFYRNMLPKPYSNCIHNWNSVHAGIVKLYEKHKYYDHFDFEYNQMTCFEFCLLVNITKVCNYTIIGKLYENSDLFNGPCYAQAKASTALSTHCEAACPVKCHSMSYHLNLATARSTSNKTVVNVFYDETSYYEITDEATLTADELVASIGGQLGLYIGMSVLSIIDLLFLLFTLLISAAFNKQIRL